MLRSYLLSKMKDNIDFCHICLATDIKIFCEPQLQSWYNDIIYSNMNCYTKERNTFCYECAYLLMKNNTFKEKCLKGQKALEEINLSEIRTAMQIDIIREKQNFNTKLSSENTLELIDIKPNVTEDIKIETIKTENTDPLQNSNRRHFLQIEYIEEFKCKNNETETHMNPINNIISELSNSSIHDLENTESWNYNEDEKESWLVDIKIPEVEIKDPGVEVKDLDVDVKSEIQSVNKRKRKKRISSDEKSEDKIFSVYINISKWLVSKLNEEQVLLEFKKRAELPTYIKSPLKCTKCLRGYYHNDTFTRHNILAHNQKNSVVCEVCNYRLDSKCKLKKHMLIHRYKFQCRICDYSTHSLPSAKLHQEVHESGRKYVCKICAEVFLHASSYYSHVRVTHKSEHLCLMCGKSFVSSMGVLHHMKRTHYIDDSKRARKRKEGLQNTTDSPIIADKESKYYCSTCEVTFCNENAYKMHFIHSSKHIDHKLKTTKKSYRYLKKTSRYDPNLVKSIVVNENSKKISEVLPTEVMVLCEICGKSVKTATLDCHRNSHTHERMYKCDLCHLEFTQKASLNRHMVRHTGVKAFKCDMCEKRYTQCGSLKLHVRTAHLNLPYPKRNRWNKKKIEVQSASEN